MKLRRRRSSAYSLLSSVSTPTCILQRADLGSRLVCVSRPRVRVCVRMRAPQNRSAHRATPHNAHTRCHPLLVVQVGAGRVKRRPSETALCGGGLWGRSMNIRSR
eukprot:1952284-Prymnesium_polylepis.1